MHSKRRFPSVMFGASLRARSIALAIMLTLLSLIFVFVFITLTAQPAHGQSYNVIYNFTGGRDGAQLVSGLTMDREGNFYGTTSKGGIVGPNCPIGCGTVFELRQSGRGLVFNRLYAFTGGS
jgi:hypothetical protein